MPQTEMFKHIFTIKHENYDSHDAS